MSRAIRGVLATLAIGATIACGGPVIVGDTIATIDDEVVSRSEFRLYLRMNLLDTDATGVSDSPSSGEEQTTDADAEPAVDSRNDEDEVRSRLLDAFIDERLLLAEAERRGLEVDELEVAAYLAPSLEDTDAPPVLPQSRRVAARRRLKVDRLREAIVREQPPPQPAEIDAYLERHRARLSPKPRFVLRPLLFESLDQAKAVHREIRRGRLSFDEAVVNHAPTNVRVTTVQVAPEALPEEVRTRLETQRIGTTSPPFDMHGQVYLFRLEDRITVDPEAAESTAAALAREELERLHGKAAVDRLVAGLRERARIRIVASALPFSYRPPRRDEVPGLAAGRADP